MTPTRMDRFLAKRVIDPKAGCWIWQAWTDKDGYGRFWDGEKTVVAHVWVYRHLIGEVPDGMILDHVVCDTPSCVRPGHLSPATQKQNVLRSPINRAAMNASKTHCPQGHPYEANRNSQGDRICRRCRVEATRRWRERNGV